MSVIIPVKDRPRSLRRCLASVQRVEYRKGALEVLLVDDGSSDNGPRWHVRSGRASSRRAAAASARGREEPGAPRRRVARSWPSWTRTRRVGAVASRDVVGAFRIPVWRRSAVESTGCARPRPWIVTRPRYKSQPSEHGAGAQLANDTFYLRAPISSFDNMRSWTWAASGRSSMWRRTSTSAWRLRDQGFPDRLRPARRYPARASEPASAFPPAALRLRHLRRRPGRAPPRTPQDRPPARAGVGIAARGGHVPRRLVARCRPRRRRRRLRRARLVVEAPAPIGCLPFQRVLRSRLRAGGSLLYYVSFHLSPVLRTGAHPGEHRLAEVRDSRAPRWPLACLRGLPAQAAGTPVPLVRRVLYSPGTLAYGAGVFRGCLRKRTFPCSPSSHRPGHVSGTDPDLAECAARAGLRLPSALTIAITGRCNLGCRHCWVEADPHVRGTSR